MMQKAASATEARKVTEEAMGTGFSASLVVSSVLAVEPLLALALALLLVWLVLVSLAPLLELVVMAVMAAAVVEVVVGEVGEVALDATAEV